MTVEEYHISINIPYFPWVIHSAFKSSRVQYRSIYYFVCFFGIVKKHVCLKRSVNWCFSYNKTIKYFYVQKLLNHTDNQ